MNDVDDDSTEELAGQADQQGSEPDVTPDRSGRAGGSLELDSRSIWDDMRARFARSEHVRAEDYCHLLDPGRDDVEQADSARARDDFLLDIVYAEFLLRQERGESVAIDEYLERFPQLADAIRQQFAIHACLAGEQGAGPPATSAKPSAVKEYRVSRLVRSDEDEEVYRSIHPFFGREVLVHLGRHPIQNDAGRKAWFEAAGRKLVQAQHPHLAHVFDAGIIASGRPFLVVEDVGAWDLTEYAGRHRLTPRQVAILMSKVARAVDAVHQQGAVHGAVAPEHIRVDRDAEPYVTGFGLLHHVPQADKPEQSVGEGFSEPIATVGAVDESKRPDRQADVLGLGLVLHFLLTTRRSRIGDGGSRFGRAQLRGSHPPDATSWPVSTDSQSDSARLPAMPRQATAIRLAESASDVRLDHCHAPRRLRAICRRCLATEAGARYASADQVAEHLERFVRSDTVVRVILAILVLSAIVGASIGLVWFFRRGTTSGSVESVAPASQHRVTESAAVSSVPMFVQIGQGDFFNELGDALPVTAGDRVRLAVGVLPEVHAALFRVDPLGKLTVLAQTNGSRTGSVLRYPVAKGASAAITGRAGTEFFFVCGRRTETVDTEEVSRLWNGGVPLPRLSDSCVLRVTAGEVRTERPGGRSATRSDAERSDAEVRRRIVSFRQAVQQAGYTVFEGVVFSHRDARESLSPERERRERF